MERLSAIDGEISELGVESALDRSFFVKALPAWRLTRAHGESLDQHSYRALMAVEDVAARFKALYDEKCDALIELRGYQLRGQSFVFVAGN